MFLVINTQRRPGPACHDLLRCATAAVLLAACTACSTLWDSVETAAAKQARKSLTQAVQERVEALADDMRTGTVAAGRQAAERVIVFTNPDGTTGVSERGWPVMRMKSTATQHPPQLVLEGPVHGIVFLDDQDVGLVQAGSVRIMTLTPGEHQIRIEHPSSPAMTAQFHIDTGERMSLRWDAN